VIVVNKKLSNIGCIAGLTSLIQPIYQWKAKSKREAKQTFDKYFLSSGICSTLVIRNQLLLLSHKDALNFICKQVEIITIV
jgi:hypothetical protein